MVGKRLQWLEGELTKWVAADVAPPDVAERIRAYYADPKHAPPSRTALILPIFAVLGAVLVGLGIIMVLANNWEELTRPMRAVLSFTPLTLSLAVVLYTLLRRRDSLAWREGSAVFNMASVGAAIALIGQTYNIPGEFGAFMLVWMLLCAPAVYLLESSTAAVLYLAGITSWAGYQQDQGGHALWFWPLAALMSWHYWRVLRDTPGSPRLGLLTFGYGVCLTVAMGIVLERALPGLWILIYAALFSIFYMASTLKIFQASPSAYHTLRVGGAIGIGVLALILTFEWPWRHIGWLYYRSSRDYHQWAAIQDYAVTLLLLAAGGALLVRQAAARTWMGLIAGSFMVCALLGYAAAAFDLPETAPVALFNLYMLCLGAGAVGLGVRELSLSRVNFGLAVLSTLIIARFFDADMPLTVRGVAFIAVGIAFLIANSALVRRKRTQS